MLIEPDAPETPPGVRARYRAMLRVGPVPVGGDVEIVEYDARARARLDVADRHRPALPAARPRPPTAGARRLTVRFGYSSPGALGFVADLAAFRSVRSILREAVERLVARAEGGSPTA